MGTVLKVLKRDFTRLIKVPAALIVVVVLLVLPSLYAWFNVAGFWNPYDNTGNMRVCVVNEDQGAYSDLTGMLNMGEEIVSELSNNDQLGWTFTDRDSALEEVRSGKAYAAFIIPNDFSADTLTLFGADFHQPSLQYYVNEKAGGISTKVTDSGATSLDQTINDSFVSTVSETIARVFDEKIQTTDSDISSLKTGIDSQLSSIQTALQDSKSSIQNLQSIATDSADKASAAKDELQTTKSTVSDLKQSLNDTSQLLSSLQGSLGPFTLQLMSGLDESSVLASEAASNVNGSIGSVSGAISNAQGSVSSAVEQGSALVNLNTSLIESLQSVADSLPEGSEKDALNSSIAALESQNQSLSSAISGINSSYSSIEQASTSVSAASDSLNSAVQNALQSGDGYRQTLIDETFPALNTTSTSLIQTSGDLARAIDNQILLIDKASAELDQLHDFLLQTSSTLEDTVSLIDGISQDFESIQVDISALSNSEVLTSLFGENGLDPDKISEFMYSPAKIETVSLYSVNSYGSAMAPLFMNLTLWIGVFMLLVILRTEVDREGISHITARQSYVARLLFFGVLAALQAIICCTGNIVLGVEVANGVLFYVTAIVASLTYLCIQYALSVLLQHVGKGLCVILIFVQIPGATGLYPIEMTPEFFQTVYPLFPFTYGINALRETIAGFYGMQWGSYIGVLLIFACVFLCIGLLLRPYFVNVNRMVAHQIKESDIINGEDAQLPARRYRSALLFRALINQKAFREEIFNRADTYKQRYDKGKHVVLGIIIGFPVVATIVLSFLSIDKVILLTVWLVWLVLVIMFVIIVEFIRDRLNHEVALSSYSNEKMKRFFDELGIDVSSSSGKASHQEGDSNE